MVRSPSPVTRIRHRPVATSAPGSLLAATVEMWASSTPAAMMSWRKVAPKSSSATLPM